jgi:flagellar protein FliS
MAAQGYAKTYRDTAILTASPGQLVLMLFDGALKALELAQEGFKRPPRDFKRLEVINANLIKAQRILGELQGGLNMEAGGEFAQTMHRLYTYHRRRLFEANIRKQVEPVIEVERLLRDIRDAWATMLSRGDGRMAEENRNVA